jgi:hypothetical protein
MASEKKLVSLILIVMLREAICCQELDEHNDRNACPPYPRHHSACTIASFLQAYRNCVNSCCKYYMSIYARLCSIQYKNIYLEVYLVKEVLHAYTGMTLSKRRKPISLHSLWVGLAKTDFPRSIHFRSHISGAIHGICTN